MISIDVLIHLKDLNGAIVYDFPESFRIKTELVYADGSSAPCFVKYSLKNKANSKEKNISFGAAPMKLFHPTRPEPVLGQGKGSCHFSFRIEEVSSHHAKNGFKLKVSPYLDTAPSSPQQNGSRNNIFHGIMEGEFLVNLKD